MSTTVSLDNLGQILINWWRSTFGMLRIQKIKQILKKSYSKSPSQSILTLAKCKVEIAIVQVWNIAVQAGEFQNAEVSANYCLIISLSGFHPDRSTFKCRIEVDFTFFGFIGLINMLSSAFEPSMRLDYSFIKIQGVTVEILLYSHPHFAINDEAHLLFHSFQEGVADQQMCERLFPIINKW